MAGQSNVFDQMSYNNGVDGGNMDFTAQIMAENIVSFGPDDTTSNKSNI